VNEYPEHEKLKLVSSSSHTIAFFLEWLGAQGIALCERYVNPESGRDGEYVRVRKSTEDLLASYYGIDLKKIEEEKRAMLDAMREATGRVER